MAEGSGRKAKDKKSYYLSRRGRGREKVEDPCRIFVANISFKINEDELAEFFSAEFGPVVSAEILKDHKRKLSRGIGFVTFSSVELAQQALAAPPEKLILDGRDLRVDVAMSKRQWSRAQCSKITAVECDEGDGRAGDRESSVAVNQQDSLLLNDDILFRVFSYLSLKERVRAERVCRQWRAVARRWWKSLKTLSFEGVFVTFKCALTDSIFSSILHRGCHKLKSLDVSASPTQLTEHSLQLIGKCCEELISLNISRVHTTPQSLKTLTQHCTKLKTLIVRGCHSVGEKSLWWTLRHCQQLQELDVSQNKRLNGQCFFMAPPTLLSVCLRECDQLTDTGVTLLAQRTPNLQCLDISQCSRLGGESLRSLSKARLSPEVEYIEEESMVQGTQVPWHLDRLDQHQPPLNQFYLPVGSGRGVDLYILDSGINYAHEEFENRAKYSGVDPIDFYLGENGRGADCHGHGTHVASLAAGKTYGVAKSARLYSVRVLGCDNSGPWSAVLLGLEHVMLMVKERGRPAVVSQSFGGSYFRAVDEAVREIHSNGIFATTSAGNGQADACQRTPASSTYTLTVGGTRNDDDIYSFTNYGSCVDIFAPGQNIIGADYLCNSCSKVLSGTSMATPMVSGAAAILLAREPLLKPQAIRDRLIASSVKNILNFERIPSNFRSRTSNRMLNVAGECGGELRAPVVIHSPNYPMSYPHNLQAEPCQWTVSAAPTERLRCAFTDFDTEEDYDVVSVCEGRSCCASSVTAEWSGSLSLPPSYTSTRPSLTFTMTSDGIINRRGFSLSCSPLASAPVTTPPTTTPSSTTMPPVTTETTPPMTLPPLTTPIPVTMPPLSTLPLTMTTPLTTDVTVGNEDFQAVASIPSLEHLVVDQQMSFDDTVLNQISVVRKLRRLSCAACYAVSDQGVTNLSCVPLTRLNLSYCHLVSDIGVSGLAKTGTLQKLVVRACPNLTDKGLIDVSKCCTELTELDVSGCWQLTDSVLYALQESLLHMRVDQNLHFSLTVGGTSISGESALQFARITGSTVCLDDLSTDSLNPWLDYNSTVESMPADEEDWDPVGTPSAAVESKPEPAEEEDWDPVGTPSASVAKPVTPAAEDKDGGVQFINYSMERAYDWLEADDPALFSDEFSDPEEWGIL